MPTVPTSVVALLAAGCLLLGTSSAQTQPNLLILVGDDLSPELVGCYGGTNPVPTPNLDQIANQGVRFTRAYADPICSPTRASLLTGRHGFRTGIDTTIFANMSGLPLAETTLPEALATTGYAAAAIGKWHVGGNQGPLSPNLHGWPHFAGFLDGGIPNYWSWPKVVDGVATTCTNYATTDQVDDALAWIGTQTQPWVLMLNFAAPHAPYHAPPAALHTQDLSGLTPATAPRAYYRAMVESMDTEIGRLLAGIALQLPNTNIVFVGDNGTAREVADPAHNPSHAKGSVYEGGCRVPLIISGPCVTQPARAYDDVVNVLDLFPTMLELCGTSAAATVPPGTVLDGVSLTPALRFVPGPVRPFAYVEEWGTGFGDGIAAIGPQYKLLRFSGGGTYQHEELYDLLADPDEQTDLLRQPGTPAITAAHSQLQQSLDQLRLRGYALRIGTGCQASNGIADLMTYRTSPPQLGGFYPVTPYGGSTNGSPCITVFGWSDTVYNGHVLPLELSAFGMPGCNLLTSIDAMLFVGGVGQTFSLGIPNQPAFLWGQFHLQSFVVEPGVNATGVVVSNALRCTIGQ